MSDLSSVTALPSAPQTAVRAIQRSVQNLDQDASVVANSEDVMSRDTVQALVDSRQQLLYTQAAAKILSAADEMTQSLLDVHA